MECSHDGFGFLGIEKLVKRLPPQVLVTQMAFHMQIVLVPFGVHSFSVRHLQFGAVIFGQLKGSLMGVKRYKLEVVNCKEWSVWLKEMESLGVGTVFYKL